MKRYLLTMTLLLLAALIAGIVVWYFYQDLNPRALVGSVQESEHYGDVVMPISDIKEMGDEDSTVQQSAAEADESITVSANSLTENQRKILESFGMNQTEFVITQAMIVCIEEGIGESRLEELLNGGAPTPLEALRLLPCMKK